MNEVAGTKRAPASLPPARESAIAAARAAAEKKAFDVRILEVGSLIVITDYFVVASGTTERQVRTIVGEVEKTLAAAGLRAIRREGEHEGRWVLLDFGDVVVHVFANEERQYYELERLWKDAPEISWSDAMDGGAEAETGSSSSSSGSAPAGSVRARG